MENGKHASSPRNDPAGWTNDRLMKEKSVRNRKESNSILKIVLLNICEEIALLP